MTNKLLIELLIYLLAKILLTYSKIGGPYTNTAKIAVNSIEIKI